MGAQEGTTRAADKDVAIADIVHGSTTRNTSTKEASRLSLYFKNFGEAAFQDLHTSEK